MVIDILRIDFISTHTPTHLNYHIYNVYQLLKQIYAICLHNTPWFSIKVEFDHEILTGILQDQLIGNLFWLLQFINGI